MLQELFLDEKTTSKIQRVHESENLKIVIFQWVNRPPGIAVAIAEKAAHLGAPNPWFLFELGHAYYLSGRYEEAMSILKQLISRAPNILHAQLFLALAASEAEREEEARAAAAEVLRINPKFSLDVLRQRATIKDPAVLERHIAALRKAGLK